MIDKKTVMMCAPVRMCMYKDVMPAADRREDRGAEKDGI